ncbi:MAG TPA: LysM peptidoglycan-binding domain-containing protein [Acidobacteriota bacterium]|nr:LysM peptidoglycan-binding domain-containing protein [Acidobacteriota bacterium]
MMKAWLKLVFGFMACFFLISYGTCIAQTEEQSQTQDTTQQVQEQATPEETQTAQETQASPQPKSGELPVPLEAEMVVAEHWSRNPYPRTVAAGARVHIVERGDTLWDLAQRYYSNPFLWPQIWDANKYIPNAHWIYPGDPVIIPPLTPVSEQMIAEQTQPGPEGEPGGPGGPSIPAPGMQAYPIALDVDLYCSGFIVPDTGGYKVKIIGNEENTDKVTLSLFDIVYINQGEADGISPGDEFTVLQYGRKLQHPITLETLGDYVVQTGRLKIVATQERTSTAQITYSCDSTLVGDFLVPFEPKEVPNLADLPPVDRFSVEGPNQKGYVVFAKDDLTSLGEGHEVQIDVGAAEGITVGTRLIIYRHQTTGYENTGFERDIPRRVLGEMVVFSVQDSTSTGRIIQMYDYMVPGDSVEVR